MIPAEAVRKGLERETFAIPIYVRKGRREDSRLMSFQLPTKDMYLATMISRDVLGVGLAFDGNSVLVEVTPRTKVSRWQPNAGTPEENEAETVRCAIFEGAEETSLSAALVDVQIALRDWLLLIGAKVYPTASDPKLHVYFT